MPFYDWCCSVGGCGEHKETFEHRPKPKAPSCTRHCLPMIRDWHGEARAHTPGNVFPYTTRNINGQPLEVKSHAHLKELCKEHGVRLRDDNAFIDSEYKGYDIRTGKQSYSEGSGRGLPGQWV